MDLRVGTIYADRLEACIRLLRSRLAVNETDDRFWEGMGDTIHHVDRAESLLTCPVHEKNIYLWGDPEEVAAIEKARKKVKQSSASKSGKGKDQICKCQFKKKIDKVLSYLESKCNLIQSIGAFYVKKCKAVASEPNEEGACGGQPTSSCPPEEIIQKAYLEASNPLGDVISDMGSVFISVLESLDVVTNQYVTEASAENKKDSPAKKQQ